MNFSDPSSIESISTLPILTEEERQQLLIEWNDTKREYPQDKCIHQLVEAQVMRTPERIAAIFEDRSLTYQEVNEKANELAGVLKAKGISKGKYVPVLMEKSLELLISHLAIMKVGAAFVPMSPRWPIERIAEILNQLNSEVVLINQVDSKWSSLSNWSYFVVNESKLIGSKSNLNLPVQLEDPIYIIFTSGSTGKPKGAINQHCGIVNRFFNMNDRYGIQDNDVILFTSDSMFDASVWQLFWPLINGMQVVIPDANFNFEPNLIIELVEKRKVTITDFVPAVFNILVDYLNDNLELYSKLSSLRQLLIGGEQMNSKAIYQFKSFLSQVGITNTYGPTETSIGVIFHEVPSTFTDPIPIGRPLHNVYALILDHHLNPVPVGVSGELYLGGQCVGLGYLNHQELTRSVFIDNPFEEIDSDRLYKTGDLVRYLPDGTIEFLGRIDNQVKIRGIRIELGEIESVLTQHPQVKRTIVIPQENRPGDKRLVAYLVTNQEQTTIDELRSFLQERLPEYMMPSAFVLLETIPLTPNGKVDRRALPSPDLSSKYLEASFVPPRNTLEMQLAQIWSEVLGLPSVGVRDNFFTLGGNSLLAVQLMVRIEKHFGKQLPLARLSEHPTIEKLAAILLSSKDPKPESPLVIINSAGDRPPFFCVHPGGGNVLCYGKLASYLGSEQPFYGLQSVGLNGEQEPLEKIEEMATLYIEALQTIQPQGSYYLGGWSMGGLIAFEIAQQLQARGHEIALLALIDSYPCANNMPKEADDTMLVSLFAKHMGGIFGHKLFIRVDDLKEISSDRQLKFVLEQAKGLGILSKEVSEQHLSQALKIFKANCRAIYSYLPQPYSGQIKFFRATDTVISNSAPGWESFAVGDLEIHEIIGDHYAPVREPQVQVLAKYLSSYIEKL
ncbi:MAG: amino acid adenylation domain-containing protein [Moorea sp. SIO2B7]|nr:amino acid adenylation domain-containing protein [Moorena sp. SIO2B7]